MKIRVTAPDGTQYIGYWDDGPTQRDALLIARRQVSGLMDPAGYTAECIDLYAQRPEGWPIDHWKRCA